MMMFKKSILIAMMAVGGLAAPVYNVDGAPATPDYGPLGPESGGRCPIMGVPAPFQKRTAKKVNDCSGKVQMCHILGLPQAVTRSIKSTLNAPKAMISKRSAAAPDLVLSVGLSRLFGPKRSKRYDARPACGGWKNTCPIMGDPEAVARH